MGNKNYINNGDFKKTEKDESYQKVKYFACVHVMWKMQFVLLDSCTIKCRTFTNTHFSQHHVARRDTAMNDHAAIICIRYIRIRTANNLMINVYNTDNIYTRTVIYGKQG